MSMRYHHLLNWLVIARDWFNPAASNGVSGRIRQAPWEYADTPHSRRILRTFCHIKALEHAQEWLTIYQKTKHHHEVAQDILGLLEQVVTPEQQQVTHHLLMSLRRIILNSALYTTDMKLVGTNALKIEELNGWLQLVISKANSTEIAQFTNLLTNSHQQVAAVTHKWLVEKPTDFFHQENAQLLARYEENASQFTEDVRTFLDQIDQEILPFGADLAAQLARFFHTETKPLILPPNYLGSLADMTELKQATQQAVTYFEEEMIYAQDVYGPGLDQYSQIFQASINKHFLAYYQLFKVAATNPEALIYLSFEPDMVCRSSRGGENLVGDHCVVPLMENKSTDHRVRDALVKVLLSSLLPVSTGQIETVVKQDDQGKVTQLGIPIKLLFHLPFIEKIRTLSGR